MRSPRTALVIGVFLLLSNGLLRGDTFTAGDIGEPAVAGSVQTNSTGGIVLTGAGASLGLRGDQGYFAWRQQEGDFDLAVRVESLAAPDVFGRAGLMARDSLDPTSRLAGVLATPTVAGILFQTRETSGGTGKQTGQAFANYPYAWLRLQRTGSVWTSAASGDGQVWTRLDKVTLSLSNTVYLGLAVASWRSNETATAVFRDFGPVQGEIEPEATPELELPGPCSRRTGLVISEIMYHPAARPDGRDLEFVELFNSQSIFEEISGYRLSGAVDFTFPPGTILPAGGFIVVARAPADVQAVYGLTNVLGGYTNRMDGSSGVVRLRSRISAVLLEAQYGSKPPWPAAADGAGHSLVLARPSLGERDVQAWAASRQKGGSPGRWDGYRHDAYTGIIINELRARSDGAALDYIELYNHSNRPADLSGAWLSDTPATNKFRIPDGTIVPARGFISFDATVLGFALRGAGEPVYLSTPDQSRVIDAVHFDAQGPNTTFGRSPDGASTWRALAQATPAAPNSSPVRDEVVFSEIMFQPISGENDDQYIELHNRGTNTLNLSGWRLTSGLQFTFPIGTVLAAGSNLVVAKNANRLLTNYPYLTPRTCVGNFQGSLSGGGERLVLSRPEQASPGQTNWITAAEASYKDGGRWGRWADGGGSSLERTDLEADPTLAANWADSDETAKGQWTTLEHTGVLDLGMSGFGINQVQILLEGVGECLVDNVEVVGPGGTNLVTNGDFENGLTGWTPQGSHSASIVEPGTGVNGSQCLHLQAESRGDPSVNRIRANVATGLKEGNTVTLRAHVRWLSGFPEILVRLRGNYLETAGRMRISPQLGTPGLRNSRALSNAPPAIYDVTHFPILPAIDQPVTVTARVHDPDGVSAFVLRYRMDPAADLTEVPMRDDGKEGDAIADDGLFSALIPAQTLNGLVAFHLAATDASAAPASATFPSDAPARECLVRFGETQPGGSFGTYRIWMTQAVRNRWTSREKLNNAPLDVTFVYGNRRVIYNAGALYAGSPFVSSGYSGPTGALCGYVVRFPSDDPFLGVTDLKLDWPVRDGALQMEQVAYWIADQLGVPSNHRRFVHLFVNGARRGTIYEDAQQPNSEMVAQYFPDDQDGELFKIDDWFEFDNAGSSFNNTDATLDDFTTTDGQKKTARYRWNWRKHAVKDSANDYQSLFGLIDATRPMDFVNFAQTVEGVIDAHEYLGVIALEHLVGNWDSFGYFRGKNMFTYKPKRGKWNLLTWDIDFVLSAQGYPVTSGLFDTIDSTISQILYHPHFRRLYYRIFEDAVQGPLLSTRFSPVLAANYTALLANGVSASNPSIGSNYLTGRLKYLVQELSQTRAPFALDSTNNAFITEQSPFVLQGTAPLDVDDVQVNGLSSPIVWVDVNRWQVRLPLSQGTNHFQITARDRLGQRVPGGQLGVDVVYIGTAEAPQGRIVFNEIMHHPAVPGAEYVELFNRSSAVGFDLSGWRISGLDYTFPTGSFIPQRSYLVLAKNRSAFFLAYGRDLAPFDNFPGNLSPEGETLRLIKPGQTPGEETVVAEVTYTSQPPWPQAASQGGVALQLRDVNQSDNRIGNWGTYAPKPAVDWELVSVTGPASSSRVLLYLSSLPPIRDITTVEGAWDGQIGGGPSSFRIEFRRGADGTWQADFVYNMNDDEQRFSFPYVRVTNNVVTLAFSEESSDFRFTLAPDGMSMTGTYQPPQEQAMAAGLKRSNPGGDVYLDDLCLNKGAERDPAANLIVNGDFEAPLVGSWIVSSNHLATALSTSIKHAGESCLHLAATQGGYLASNAVWQEAAPLTAGEIYTLSYWLHRGSKAAGAVVRLEDWSLVSARNLQPVKVRPSEFTPGRANSNAADLPEMPLLWLNEVQPVNVTGPVDRFGAHGGWVELFNQGTSALTLTNYFLASSYSNLTEWPFPPKAVLQPGAFALVWLDDQPDKTTDSEWHANFRLPQTNGVLVLSRRLDTETQILDYLQYARLTDDASLGLAQPGSTSLRLVFSHPTPLLLNQGTAAPGPLFINEWMAANRGSVADPADGRFDDWFEIYNPNPAPVDLAGYRLSDSTANPGKFLVPAGTVIPAHGYLLVWADEESQRNGPGADLHVNFKLGTSGEMILLSAPDGSPVDTIQFGEQTSDLSEGRWPDGAVEPFRSLTRSTPGAPNIWESELRLAGVESTTDGHIVLRWASQAGQEFRIEYNDDLTQAHWTTLPQSVVATSPETQLTLEAPANNPHRFYRLVQLSQRSNKPL